MLIYNVQRYIREIIILVCVSYKFKKSLIMKNCCLIKWPAGSNIDTENDRIQVAINNKIIKQIRRCRYSMASASPDNIKQWKFPNGDFLQNLSGHNAIINTLAVNEDGVLVSGGTSSASSMSSFA